VLDRLLQGFEDTVEILADMETLAALEAGLLEIELEETVELEELREELAGQRPTS